MTKAYSVVSSSENQLQHILGLLLCISGNNENIRRNEMLISETQFYELETFQM